MARGDRIWERGIQEVEPRVIDNALAELPKTAVQIARECGHLFRHTRSIEDPVRRVEEHFEYWEENAPGRFYIISGDCYSCTAARRAQRAKL